MDYKKEFELQQKLTNRAICERNDFILYLTRVYGAHTHKNIEENKVLEKQFPLIVCIHTEKGQLSWHIPEEDIKRFEHFEIKENDWDGHSIEEKYKRLALLPVYEGSHRYDD